MLDLVFRGSKFKKGLSDGPMLSRDFFGHIEDMRQAGYCT